MAAAAQQGGAPAPQVGFARGPKVIEPEDAPLQKARWKRMTQRIVGAINKTSKTTVPDRAVDLLRQNIERGRGVFCKAIMKSQEANPDMSDLFAALASVINRQFPSVGLLLVKRLIIQWRRYYGRKFVDGMKNEARFLSQLYVFGVCDDSIVLELLIALLCQDPIGDLEIEAASALFKDSYKVLESRNPKAFYEILVPMRDLLQADPKILSNRSESVVEALLEDVRQWQKVKHDESFIDPNLIAIVEANADSEMEPHSISLDDPCVGGEGGQPFGDPEVKLDSYQYDDNYAANEAAYEDVKRVILGPLADEPATGSYEDDGEAVGNWEEDEHDGAAAAAAAAYSVTAATDGDKDEEKAPKKAPVTPSSASAGTTNNGFSGKMSTATLGAIHSTDELKAHLNSLFSPDAVSPFAHAEDIKIRTTIVTAIQSSISADESTHKLLKGLVPGSEPLVCSLVTEACAQEPLYRKNFALIAERLCRAMAKMQHFWSMLFKYRYYTAESMAVAPLDVNARIFAHLLGTDAISWQCLEVADISASNRSQRILIGKIITLLCTEYLSPTRVSERFKNRDLAARLKGLFPIGDPEKVLQAILFFKGIGGVDVLKSDLEQWYIQNEQQLRKRARE